MKTLKELLPNEYDNVRWSIGGDWSIWIEKNVDRFYGEDDYEWYLCELFYKDDYLSGLEFFKVEDSDTKETIISRLKEEMKDTFICVADNQGGTFEVGNFMTIKDWKKWALQDRDNSCDDYFYNKIKRLPLKKVIDFICSLWDIEIIKVVLD